MLEIYRYIPPPLLKDIDVGELDIDEFLRLLARARYLQEVEFSIIQRAVVKSFPEK